MSTAQKFINLDADESVFFSRQLESVKTKSYDVKYPELKARTLIPVSMDAGSGAETINYKQYDQVGMAKIISNYAKDLPRVDVKAKEFTAKVKSLGASYGYTVQEVRAAKMAGVPLEQRKANAAKRAVLLKEENIACTGDTNHGLVGLFSHPNIADVAIPADGTGASAAWSAKTADLIVRDCNLLVSQVLTQSLGVEQPDTMIVPDAQYNLMATKQMTGINQTALKFFLETSPYIKEVIPWSRLKGAGAGGSDMFMVYKKSPDYLTLEVPQDFEQFPAQEKGLEYEIPTHSRCGGVIVYYPLAFAKGDAI